ncbi:MAG: hypothetical protein ACI8XC_002649 [Gammaproteobacteria bacterium]|jgi:hypothetical protein
MDMNNQEIVVTLPILSTITLTEEAAVEEAAANCVRIARPYSE